MTSKVEAIFAREHVKRGKPWT